MGDFTPEQRDERQSRIGASEVAAILGLSRWATPLSVWADKVYGAEEDDAEHLRWGHLIEDVVLDEWQRRTDLIAGMRQAMFRHPDHPHHGATPDGLAFERRGRGAEYVSDPTNAIAVLDVKNDASYGYRDGELPDVYVIQAQWQMWVTGLGEARMLVLHAGRKLVEYIVPRDELLITDLVRAVDHFWNRYVVTKTMPPPDGSDITSDTLRRIFPWQEEGKSIVIDSDLAEVYRIRRRSFETAKRRFEEAKQELMARMGDAEYAIDPGGNKLFSWRAHEQTRIDTNYVRENHPRITKKASRTTTVRTFRDHLPKEEEA